MHLTVLTPILTAIAVMAISARSDRKADSNATVYRYPRVMSVIMMVTSALAATAVLWPGAFGDIFTIVAFESFCAIFFVIGVGLEFFRITVFDDVIVQGYWPVKNVIWFKDVVSVRSRHLTKDSYLLLTLRNGKNFKFEYSLDNFDGLCERVIKLARQHGVTEIIIER